MSADGTPISLFHCHGSPNQQWIISNGHITTLGGSCLDVQGSAPNGQVVGIGGKCLDTSGGGTADHTPLILAACSSAPSQQWSVR